MDANTPSISALPRWLLPRTWLRPGVLAVLLAALVATGSRAQAQATSTEGFALNRFDVAEVGSDWFVGDSLDLRGHVRPGVRLAVDWAYKPLVRYDGDGNELSTVIKNQLFGHAGVGLILWDRLRLGANLPVLLYQNGTPTVVDGQTYGAAEGAALGDLRLAADVRLVGEYGDLFSLAIGAALALPTGDRDAFAGDGAIRLSPRAMMAGDIGPFAYSARVGFNYRPQDDGFGTVPTGSEVAFVATAGFRLLDRALLLGPELYGTTVVSEGGAAFETETTPFELLFGAHLRGGDWIGGVGVGPGLNRGLGAPEVRVVGSLTFIPDASDRDKDGILDDDDACPDLAGTPNDDPALHGCPDRDGDRIIDPVDACPDTPGVASDDPDKHGCPDRDGDGIVDSVDACPDTPGVASDDPDKHGCPPDRDGDGIYDDDDACPDVPGVANEDPKKNGCPPDRDGDGIYDDDDACPDVPGVANEDPEKHGCPIARVEGKQIKITQRIEFETDRARIRPESEVVMQAVLQILLEHPEIEQVRVEGHTDNVGAAAYNRRLSQKRAASVVSWLVEHGIDRLRLLSEGFGLERPIADNDTPVGRQKNRRVEFHITQEGEGTDAGQTAGTAGAPPRSAPQDEEYDDGSDDVEEAEDEEDAEPERGPPPARDTSDEDLDDLLDL